MTPAKTTYVRIQFRKADGPTVPLRHFTAVIPRLDLRGSWPVEAMIPAEQVVHLRVIRDYLDRCDRARKKRRLRAMQHMGGSPHIVM